MQTTVRERQIEVETAEDLRSLELWVTSMGTAWFICCCLDETCMNMKFSTNTLLPLYVYIIE